MNNLSQDGYFITPQILSSDIIEMLWRDLEVYFKKSSTMIMPPRDFFKIPHLSKIPFLPVTVAALKAQLGDDFVTIPEYVVQANKFGGWHTDAGNQGTAELCYKPDYMQIQCAIYLQDNDKINGGGLDVKKKGHREYLTFLPPFGIIRRGVRSIMRRITPTYSIPSKAGDLLGFHFRLLHRATPQSSKRQKFAIFWVAEKNTPEIQPYLEHLKTIYGRDFLDFEYSLEALNLIAQQKLNVAGLTIFRDKKN